MAGSTEGSEDEQHADDRGEWCAVPREQHDDGREQQERSRERHEDAQIEPVQRFDIANEARQHVARPAEAKPARRTACDPPEEPNPQIGEGTKRRCMGGQPLDVAQHHPCDAQASQGDRRYQHARRQRRSDDGACHTHQPDRRGKRGEPEHKAHQQPS